MDCNKVGILLKALRKEKGMTQRHIADQMHISDKTISKWERCLGCPDVSLLGEKYGSKLYYYCRKDGLWVL